MHLRASEKTFKVFEKLIGMLALEQGDVVLFKRAFIEETAFHSLQIQPVHEVFVMAAGAGELYDYFWLKEGYAGLPIVAQPPPATRSGIYTGRIRQVAHPGGAQGALLVFICEDWTPAKPELIELKRIATSLVNAGVERYGISEAFATLWARARRLHGALYPHHFVAACLPRWAALSFREMLDEIRQIACEDGGADALRYFAGRLSYDYDLALHAVQVLKDAPDPADPRAEAAWAFIADSCSPAEVATLRDP